MIRGCRFVWSTKPLLGALSLAVLAVGVAPLSSPAAGPAKAAPNKGRNDGKKDAGKPAAPPIVVPARKQKISNVSAEGRARALESAAQIDRLIEANYKKHNVTPNEMSSDAQFIRRIHLDIAGTIPRYKQVRTFLTLNDSQKRVRLIDSLLNQEGYASNFYNYWADILRLKDGAIANNVPGRPYCEWVKESLEKNTPYDKFVYEMLTAEGKVWENPAAGYVLRDSGMPLDWTNNTVRIFLGTQIGCAQCHNHPFDRWTQREFYEMAAFTFPTATRKGGGKEVQKLREDLKKIDDKFLNGGKYNRFFAGNTFVVFENPKTQLLLPHDYQYSDGKPKQPVAPRTIFGPTAVVGKGESPRAVFAKWLTSPQNPRFAKTIANRLWKKSFGVGLIEPEDDIKDDTVAENPELMDFLTSEMIRLKFDMKEFLRIIYNTKAYQREATHAEVTPGEEYHFPGPILRRMTAEQVWDSFVTLAVFSPEEYQIEPANIEANLLNIDFTKITAQEIFDRDKELRSPELKKVRDARDKDHRYKGLLLVRASEIPQPPPAGHFLRQFGQSDRESIQSSSEDGSVPQVLQMFNGPITHMLLEEGSLLHKTIVTEKTTESRVDAIFMSILSRRADADERTLSLQDIKKHGTARFGNVIWSLVNTREFLFIQ